MKRWLAGCALAALAACSPTESDVNSRAESAPPGSVVDSARTMKEELDRFRAALPGGVVHELASPARSRDELVERWLRALQEQDTAALGELLLDSREFAWLYYPYTVYTHPPYLQPAGMVWLFTQQNSQKGLSRMLRELGGRNLERARYGCARTEPQDLNVLHQDCGVLLPGDSLPRSLFGTIIERHGRFKFVSYANGL